MRTEFDRFRQEHRIRLENNLRNLDIRPPTKTEMLSTGAAILATAVVLGGLHKAGYPELADLTATLTLTLSGAYLLNQSLDFLFGRIPPSS